MNIKTRFLALCLIGLVLFMLPACSHSTPQPIQEPLTRPDESFLQFGETNETIVELTKINSSVWVHTSYYEENGALLPTNGLVVLTNKSVVLIDTPHTEAQLVSLTKLIKQAFNGTIKTVIVTHAHEKCMGGVAYLKKNEIPVSSLEVVAAAAQAKGLPVPDQMIEGESGEMEIDNTVFELFYPGGSATPDNTVVWIDKHNVLYGGCLIRQYGADSLGDTPEADLGQWKTALENIRDKYAEADIVVPSQGQWGDTSLIDYTLELLEE